MAGGVLITGCTGYIASHLIEALRRHAPHQRLVGTAPDAQPSRPAALDEIAAADLRDRSAAASLIERLRPEAVIHLAAGRDGELAELLQVNAAATDHLLAAMRDVVGGDARVVVVGSAAEIGNCAPSEMPLAENAVCRPIDPYGVSKLAQAAVAHAAFFRHAQNVVRVRIFNLVGPGLPAGLLPGRCVQLLRDSMAKRLDGPLRFRDLGTERDYVDIRDVCRALILALERGAPGALYHVGSGKAWSGRRVVDSLMAEARGETGPLVYEESVPSPRTVPIQVADVGLAARELGWTPAIPFENSIRDLWRSPASGEAGAGAREQRA